jgi:hypothetical protein
MILTPYSKLYMKSTKALIITSIGSDDNKALNIYAKECAERNIHFIVIGDSKSPEVFNIEHCDFFSIKRQMELPYSILKILPEKKYSRKNIGYLVAIDRGYDVISETDDDNFPMSDFWRKTSMDSQSYYIKNKGWVNVYSYFTESKIWPRAFPLECVNDEMPSIDEFLFADVVCPVQQGLADDNPDVDAVFRLVKVPANKI